MNRKQTFEILKWRITYYNSHYVSHIILAYIIYVSHAHFEYRSHITSQIADVNIRLRTTSHVTTYFMCITRIFQILIAYYLADRWCKHQATYYISYYFILHVYHTYISDIDHITWRTANLWIVIIVYCLVISVYCLIISLYCR